MLVKIIKYCNIEAYSEPWLWPLTIFAKGFMLDAWQGSEYPVMNNLIAIVSFIKTFYRLFLDYKMMECEIFLHLSISLKLTYWKFTMENWQWIIDKKYHLQLFYKKALKNFAKFLTKHLCRGIFFNGKSEDLQLFYNLALMISLWISRNF